MRILIIDSDPDTVAKLYDFLEPRGYVLDSDASGNAGLALATRHVYDAIVLDAEPAGLSGLDICRKLRSELNSFLPVILLTTRGTRANLIYVCARWCAAHAGPMADRPYCG